jgi:hypothetical protein
VVGHNVTQSVNRDWGYRAYDHFCVGEIIRPVVDSVGFAVIDEAF